MTTGQKTKKVSKWCRFQLIMTSPEEKWCHTANKHLFYLCVISYAVSLKWPTTQKYKVIFSWRPVPSSVRRNTARDVECHCMTNKKDIQWLQFVVPGLFLVQSRKRKIDFNLDAWVSLGQYLYKTSNWGVNYLKTPTGTPSSDTLSTQEYKSIIMIDSVQDLN